MKKSLVRQFEEQFGKEWVCTCSTPFASSALEIVSENKNSLIAHYVCPNCSREQMLAAAIRETSEDIVTEELKIRLPATIITADDVLDLKQEISGMKLSQIKHLDRRTAVKAKQHLTSKTAR